MRTISTAVYTFDELSPEAKERAIESFRDSDFYPWPDWHDFTLDDAKAIGAILGFSIDRIFYSGFYSQGDGASFTGTYSYSPGWRKKLAGYAPNETEAAAIGERLAAVQRPRMYGLSARITAGGRYCHSHTMSADVETASGANATDDDAREILDCARAFANWIYRRLESEYEYLLGDDAIGEMIAANEWEFLADGRRA